jgi:hydroxylamine reductase
MADTANLQDEMTGALVALATGAEGKSLSEETAHIMLAGQFTAITNVNINDPCPQGPCQRIDTQNSSSRGQDRRLPMPTSGRGTRISAH